MSAKNYKKQISQKKIASLENQLKTEKSEYVRIAISTDIREAKAELARLSGETAENAYGKKLALAS